MNLYLKFLIICSLCILSNIQLNALVYTDNDDKKVDDIIPIIVRENSQDFQQSISAGLRYNYRKIRSGNSSERAICSYRMGTKIAI